MTENPDFGTFGRFSETPVSQMPADMKDAYDFTRKLRGLVPGPHKIWLANPTLSKTIVPTGAYYQTESTLTKAEIEIATNVARRCRHRRRDRAHGLVHQRLADPDGLRRPGRCHRP
jgi:4-carboxymuconolactone decarboxylase